MVATRQVDRYVLKCSMLIADFSSVPSGFFRYQKEITIDPSYISS